MTNLERRENYRRLREAGYSPEFAHAHDRSRKTVERILSGKPVHFKRQPKITSTKVSPKTVYQQLRAKGYSAKIANRFRNASAETINLLLSKYIPEDRINNIIQQNKQRLYDKKVKILLKAGYSESRAKVLARSSDLSKVKKLAKTNRKKISKEKHAAKLAEMREKYSLLRRSGIPVRVAKKMSGKSWEAIGKYIHMHGKHYRINWVERRFMDAIKSTGEKIKRADLYGNGKYSDMFSQLLMDLESSDNSPHGPKARALELLKLREFGADYNVGDTPRFNEVIEL